MAAVLRGRAVIVIALLVFIVVVVVLIFRFVPLSTLRDLAIILLAFLNIILLAFLIAIAFALWRLVEILRRDVPPVLGSVMQTATTIQGTADFASTTAVMPLIRGVSLLFAATRFVQVLFGRRRREE
jgi:hypothetical protein